MNPVQITIDGNPYQLVPGKSNFIVTPDRVIGPAPFNIQGGEAFVSATPGAATPATASIPAADGLIIVTKQLANGALGTSYAGAVVASGGLIPYRYSVRPGGSFPPGLNINQQTGAISGLPASRGAYTFSVQVSDGTGATAQALLSVTID